MEARERKLSAHLIPPISAAPVFVGSRPEELSIVPGSVTETPPECLDCPTRQCTAGPVREGFQSCPWGFEYLRPSPGLTAFGIVARQARPTESAATSKRRRRNRQTQQVLDRQVAEVSANSLNQYMRRNQDELERALEKERESRLKKMHPTEVVETLRTQFDQFVALNHDYVKIAAGIRANLERLKRASPAIEDRPETRAIEGAARRLEDLPSLHRILVEPSIVHDWPDRTRHRLFATLESYFYYLRPIAEEQGIVLHRPSCQQGTSNAEVYASRRVLGGIFLQLIDNAMSYSPALGSVSILVDDKPEAETVAVRVEGLGPRIEPGEHDKIFLPFYRGRHAQAVREGGGVGLAIVKVAVEQIGGSVRVEQDESGPDFLTRFFVNLPKAT